jgi:hypothetical protein
MPWVGFEPTIPVLEREKIFHALERAAIVVGSNGSMRQNIGDNYPLFLSYYNQICNG